MGKILNKVLDNFYAIEIVVYVKVKLVIRIIQVSNENSNGNEVINYLKVYFYGADFQVQMHEKKFLNKVLHNFHVAEIRVYVRIKLI